MTVYLKLVSCFFTKITNNKDNLVNNLRNKNTLKYVYEDTLWKMFSISQNYIKFRVLYMKCFYFIFN